MDGDFRPLVFFFFFLLQNGYKTQRLGNKSGNLTFANKQEEAIETRFETSFVWRAVVRQNNIYISTLSAFD